MSQSVNVDLDDLEGRLVQPPIIDMLHLKRSPVGYVVGFVPSELVSSEPKETVVIDQRGATAAEFELIQGRLSEIARHLGLPRVRIDRVTHAGGAHFTVHFRGGKSRCLSDAAIDSDRALRVIGLLQSIAQVCETAYYHAARQAA